jgi:Arm DNA-binding domain/Phage integrase family
VSPTRPAKVPAIVSLSDDRIARLPLAAKGLRPYRVRDHDAPRLWLEVTSRNKLFLVRKEVRRRSMDVRIGRFPAMTVAEARLRTAEVLDKIDKGEDHRRPRKSAAGATLADAWDYYRKTLERGRRPRSLRTIQGYKRAFENLRSLHSVTLRELARDPQRVAEEHERISEKHPTTADATMRFLRACYRAYAKSRLDPVLRPEMYPTSAVVWHNRKGNEKGMGQRDLKKWFHDLLANVKDPVRREMHCFTLLTGIRRGDKQNQWESSGVTTLRWSDVSVRKREVTLQRAKGAKRIVLPISHPALRCLLRARIASRMLYPAHAKEWCFPSAIGRITEPKETSWHVKGGKNVKTTRLAPVGHALRNSFETFGRAAGIERFRMKLLMAHAVDQDITDSYTNVSALREQLREAAEAVAAFITQHGGCDPDAELTALLRAQTTIQTQRDSPRLAKGREWATGDKHASKSPLENKTIRSLRGPAV